ncbi:MAG TPA: RDD family protein [Bacteroidia bacterium]
MQLIEINTPQNVKIEYQLAGVGQRIFAFAIDFVLLFIVNILFIIFYLSKAESLQTEYIIYFILSVITCFYTLYSEMLMNGQTIGKMALGIKVIKLNGEELEFFDYFSRWSTRLIDIYFSSGVLAIIMIVSNKSGQRLGDILAGTAVIRKKSSYGFRLNDIVRLNERSRENYEFQFPLAKNLEEKDVILIKQVIQRYSVHSNSTHKNALDLLVQKVAQIVELRDVPRSDESKIKFLKQLITEYIILTR